jgi:hypothetical protein
MKKIGLVLNVVAISLITFLFLGRSTIEPGDKVEQYRFYTRSIEFDYVTWTVDALFIKASQASLHTPQYMDNDQQRSTVLDYLFLVQNISGVKADIDKIYADPTVSDAQTASLVFQQRLDLLTSQRRHVAPLGETILQAQVQDVLNQMGFTTWGAAIPPVLYHVSDLPNALIISPRNIIRQDANISLLPGLSIQQIIALENHIVDTFDVSTLVSPVGGIGTYPTMVMSTENINFLVEVIAHEWTHNYLTLRPLGLNYETTPELRTMNETTASIAGKEIGELLIKEFYPSYVPKPVPEPKSQPIQENPQKINTPAPFDFNKEMHITRVKVDGLLAENKIQEAEEYMEARRLVFWQNGYQIRKLNQAYFAFHGAYADEPGGAAGENPVGPAVRKLRSISPSLRDFLEAIAQMTSFEQLQSAIGSP